MSSWEDIANEVVPMGQPPRGLATGAARQAAIQARQVSLPPVTIDNYCIPCPALNPWSLLDVLGGTPMSCLVHGDHYSIRHRAHEYHTVYEGLAARLAEALKLGHFPPLVGARVEELLFVDIETTGLSASEPLFLIGALCFGDEPCIEFFLARNFNEERAALAAFNELCVGKRLITFNGKSFDWPYIKGRAAWFGMHMESPPAHFDLLHHARLTWRDQVPNCRLQTLELHLCNRYRTGDVPSARIPSQYREFVKQHTIDGRGAHLMAPIIHHNALDILTMAELLCIAAGV